jgi:uncharacterized protein YxjI
VVYKPERGIAMNEYRKEYHTRDGQLHRLDGPAVEYTDGYKAYYVNGQLHRLDGPAVEDADGYKVYYVNSQKHRLDGPAVEDADGYKAYYVNGKKYSEQEFMQMTSNYGLSEKDELIKCLEKALRILKGE